jgi:tRNA nucleotidyltransferase (CCA-adding enzyme)
MSKLINKTKAPLLRLVLTHEQADFDALASQLGANLMDHGLVPVLPRKLNRNVRSFMTLYGAELPFVDARDLEPGKIETVTLVDTQSLITIKGMDKHTKVSVIDHHPLRQGIPSNWELIHTETAATTTYLTELISNEHITLSVIQSTLLLLGIYEDSGTLTYSSTTGRDGRAAAYLIDKGANLQMVTEYLNPPLSEEQKVFFDRLATDAQIHRINGHRIVITCGDMLSFNEEISTMAHKLRDLFEPDALFVIVSTVEGIRMVARSTTDQIDVGSIASHFGGGGHDRAAAALIQHNEINDEPEDCNKIYQYLLKILPDFVRPSITVSQIMSGSPHVLSPETLLDEASRLMKYYGYEGYPVVETGKVVGLLTRRVVDRAINHKLKLTVASLMDANEVWVSPDDSIQYLQTRMIDSGWGQIPVVDPVSGNMIGIVTRTDLLKILSPKATKKTRDNLETQLISALPPERLSIIRSVATSADEHKIPIYVVGGFVRDLLLNRPSIDFDIVVEGDAILMAKVVASKYGGRITVHTRFGTAKWFLEKSSFQGEGMPEFLDFITARMEFYAHPTALPTIERSSIKLDLHRRDFTINTLALRLDGSRFGELYDYWGGLIDLREQLIRVLHSLSFVDDPTRMLRAIRFEQRFGFQIEDRTLRLMLDAKSLLNNLSGDRIRHEINLILDEDNCAQMLSRLSELGLLLAIHPVLPWNQSIFTEIKEWIDKDPPQDWGFMPSMKMISGRRAMGYLLWFSHVPKSDLDSICKRLKMSDALKRNICAIQTVIDLLPELIHALPSKIFLALEDIPLMAIYIAYLRSDQSKQNILEKFVVSWRKISPKVTGEDLKNMGLPPGPNYQKILQRLRSAWLDEELNSKEEEAAMLTGLIDNVNESNLGS